ncbi:MAG TPA: RusA family crossover junction endodeoxyribonuclease [Longimicrobiaceae bacterium]|nr:RusA family crossover junction endodeoxyribonuclease [Longimicrobiaceae bacterium]
MDNKLRVNVDSEAGQTMSVGEIARGGAGSVRLVLPWAVLAQVNHRMVPRARGRGLMLSMDYRQRKHAAELLVVGQMGGRRRFACPVRVEIAFHEPDRRRRDPSNLLKLIEDAMSGAVYDDDSRIHAESWIRAGVDRTNPRAEIVVTPLAAEHAA